MEFKPIDANHQPCLNTSLVAVMRLKCEKSNGESIITMYLKPGEEIDLNEEFDLVEDNK